MRLRRIQDLKIGKIHILYTILYPLLLLVLSLCMVNQGVDVSDSMYSLGSNQLFLQAEGNWTLFMAYYLANFVGFLFTRLPYGNTLLGMNVYTSLVIFATAISVYWYLGKKAKISYDIVFLGEVIALCFQWCPSTVMYNYLSYLFWTIALFCLRDGLHCQKMGKLLLAGILLGVNVFTKFPNITAAAFIVMVIYHAYLEKDAGMWNLKHIGKQIGVCVLGFVIGFVSLFVLIEAVYGAGTYFKMIQSLFAMTDTATDYRSDSMIMAILQYYLQVLPFFAGMLVAVLAGTVMIRLGSRSKLTLRLTTVVYVLCIPVLFRLYYGRGLFGIDYTSDFAVIFVATLFLWMSIAVCLHTMLTRHWTKKTSEQNSQKLDACMILVLILITPLGSNNGVYPVLNNLYLIAPVTIYLFLQIWKKRQADAMKLANEKKEFFITLSFASETMFAAFLCLMLIQGILFHTGHAFKGQDENQKRDTKIENNDILMGMRTNQSRAADLTEMLSVAEECLSQREEAALLTYGDMPGIYFCLEASPVLSTTWPELDSFSSVVMREEMEVLEQQVLEGREKPLVVLSVEEYHKMRGQDLTNKEEMIINYLIRNQYEVIYENETYLILEYAE